MAIPVIKKNEPNIDEPCIISVSDLNNRIIPLIKARPQVTIHKAR
jgi:hypothetical protein